MMSRSWMLAWGAAWRRGRGPWLRATPLMRALPTYPLDDGVRAFCRRFGFGDLPGDSGHAMVVRMADLQRNGLRHGAPRLQHRRDVLV